MGDVAIQYINTGLYVQMTEILLDTVITILMQQHWRTVVNVC